MREATATFTRAIDDQIAALEHAFIAASQSVKGSELRVERVIADFDALEKFAKLVAHHLEGASFASLPRVVSSGSKAPLGPVHKLTVPPWEAAFLVSADGRQVIGLVFSREPHNYLEKLGDLLAEHARSGDEA